MPGKKKQGSKQKKPTKQKVKEKRKIKPSLQKTSQSTSGIRISLPNLKSNKIVGELKRMRFITPYNTSQKFNITISTAKTLLKKIEESGGIQLISGSKRIKIYKPKSSPN
jgi:ribosomal protein S25